MLMQPRMEIALKFIRYHKNTSWANAHSKFLTYVWESPCWYTNIILCLSNCVIFGILLQIELKNGKKLCVTVTDCLQKKWQKILFESGSLLSWVSFYIWMIYRSKKIIIKIQKSASLGEEYIEGSGSGRCGLRLLHSTVGQSGLKPLPTTPRVI